MSASTHRSLWPREHGAYAQLAAPLVTALALRLPGPAAILLAAAACLAFLVNEPLLVVLGHRGRRMRETHGRRAAGRLAITASGAVLAGTAGLLLASRETLVVAGIAAIPAAIMFALAWKRSEHSLAGELVAVVALPGAAATVAVASGIGWQQATVLWAAWAIAYGCTVVAVHRVIARHRRAASAIDHVLAASIAAVTAGTIVLAAWSPLFTVAVPLMAISTALVIKPPRATYLRAIGVALVVASVASGALAIAIV